MAISVRTNPKPSRLRMIHRIATMSLRTDSLWLTCGLTSEKQHQGGASARMIGRGQSFGAGPERAS
jgi:hypothetical protein